MTQLKLHSTVPLIVEIPGPDSSKSDQPSLNEVVQRAIGIKM
jgi:vacuolar-type H+-ATPase subunit F/Vma7